MLGKGDTTVFRPAVPFLSSTAQRVDSYPPMLLPRSVWYLHVLCVYRGRQVDREYSQESVFSVFFPRMRPGGDTMHFSLSAESGEQLTAENPKVQGMLDYVSGRLTPTGVWHLNPEVDYSWHLESGRLVMDGDPEILR
jgi:hypothetical protein